MNRINKSQMSNQEIAIDNIPKQILFGIFHNPHESLLVLDSQGKILFMSKMYEKIGVKNIKDVIGKNIRDVLPKSEVYRVLETGRAEIASVFLVNGKERLVSRIPIKKNGKVIGAIGKVLFWEPKKIKELNKVISVLQGKIERYKTELEYIYKSRYSINNIIGQSPSILSAKKKVKKAALITSPVLITGESGTGKELFAHAIHNMSERKNFPFIRVNCSSIPRELIESELFGYEPGAFTGANPKGQKGKFAMVNR